MKFPADMQREVKLRGLFIEVELKEGKKTTATVNDFWVKMFQMKGVSELVLLPVTSNVEDNLEPHISWAN